MHGYDGHPEIELALARLYEATKEQRYLTLANYFVEQRGTEPHFYDIEYEKRQQSCVPKSDGTPWMIKSKAYSQAHLPLSEQRTATGQAVRFVYLMTAVAHLARLRQNEQQRQTCLRLWQNMVQRQIYITGAIGSQGAGEAFSSDYDLPNDTAYAESCALLEHQLRIEGEQPLLNLRPANPEARARAAKMGFVEVDADNMVLDPEKSDKWVRNSDGEW
ncbi:DUF1680 family protein [Bradyrhizobium sp. cir1]|uniref:beta-L-arabinofuranosidase domain-containing protein n=1 Tax=Bradyrhizobium sp. cir1 TaxID=1445730 RepID=UPI0017D1EABB|nr:DUF1680 family protein [Bradyrhizobium sp. cir1]